MMKAIQLTKSTAGKITVQCTDVPNPTIKSGHLLVKVAASNLNPSDRLNSNGGFPYTTFPRIPGRDFSGTVVEGPSHLVGADVFGTGGGVLGFDVDGPQAEFCLVPEGLAIHKPARLSHAQAASAGVPYSTAHLAITRARVSAKDSVLVVGATGNVGAATVQILKAMGCSQILTATRHSTSDVNMVSDPTFSTVKGLTSGRGVDVIINTVGDLGVMKNAFNALAKRGRFAFISSGSSAGDTGTIDLVVRQFYRNELELIGCNTALQTTEEVGDSLKTLSPWFESGALTPREPAADNTVKLSEVAADYQTGKTGRIITID